MPRPGRRDRDGRQDVGQAVGDEQVDGRDDGSEGPQKTHRHAASSSQLRAAQVKAHHRVRRLLISRVMRSATLREQGARRRRA